MNQFDFLQKATIGQYIPADSLLHRIDPRAKIIGFGLLILAVTFSSSGIGVLIGLLAAWIGLLTARIPIQFALKGLIPPLPFLVLIALIQIFLLPKEGEQILFVVGPISIFAANVLNSLLMMLRFCVLILLLSLMTFCISSSELIHGLQQILRPLHRLGIPTMDLVIVIQITLRFLPFLAQSAEKIAKAQASRGAEWGTKNAGFITRIRQIFPLIIPLFLTSLKRAETMALAMDARAYGFKPYRTSMFEYAFGLRDGVFLLVILFISIAVVSL
jgi:energy-coupling factor transport system permease protein